MDEGGNTNGRRTWRSSGSALGFRQAVGLRSAADTEVVGMSCATDEARTSGFRTVSSLGKPPAGLK